jgi:hypothetical protein
MPEVTDLMRVAQWAKSSGAPSDVYNAACRMLDKPDEMERHDAKLASLQALADRCREKDWAYAAERIRERDEARTERDELNDTIGRVKAFAAELRTYCSPAGIAAVYADSLETVINGAESNGGGRTPQTVGATEGQEAGEAQEGSQ